ncbi:SDR family oxidoreductase [Rhizorhabdus sp.]|uniref:SDR family NAD(P)-dependent oxidoreductase n=1 Tax=Rhizorhabdus sp. TaxID=1968843 RepID=UPI0025E1EA7F|nr:SDR family oxidoreductase [Rhizorhabdus sp.]
MMKRFEGLVVLVTGAASGIGKATALRLSEEGASLLCVDINAAGAAATAETCGNAASMQVDVSDPAACDAAVAEARARFGRLDGLANVAGVGSFGHAAATSDAEWQRVIGINLTGVFQLTRAALPAIEVQGGAIVNIASAAGLVATPYAAAYSASKSGVVGLTRSVAAEYARRGVRVNAICPGAVDTPLIAGGFDAIEGVDMDLFGRMTPLIGPVAQPEDVAAAVAFLLSRDACFITGTTLAVDGGQTAI